MFRRRFAEVSTYKKRLAYIAFLLLITAYICGAANPAPVLSITKIHSGSFNRAQQGATYTVTVFNSAGAGPTSGTVTVNDTPPTGLTVAGMSGTGWTCVANNCTRSDVLSPGSSYPPITVTVNVASKAGSPQVNQVSVSGGGSATATAMDPTNITGADPPTLSIVKTHSGNFVQGQTGATYTITVSNAAAASATAGTVTVTDTVPSGLTLTGMTGIGWTCAANACSRSDSLGPGANYPDITATLNVASNATSPQVNQVGVSGGGSVSANTSDSTIVTPPPSVLSIVKTHAANFTQGQQNAAYTVTVSNAVGAGATAGTVTVTETLPAGLTLASMSGVGWTCVTNTCTRSDALAAASSFPPITVSVNVALNATTPQVNQVGVAGGNSSPANTTDSTVINPAQPALSIAKTHAASFVQGQTNATYTITVSNAANAGPTSGTVTVTDTLPSGLTLVSIAGTGWSCSTNTCTRSDSLGTGASFPTITVTVNVAIGATSPQVNQASVSGGGSAPANVSDSTTVNPNQPTLNLSRKSLNYGYNGTLITSPQSVTVFFTSGLGIAWTASSNQSNITVLPASSSGNGVIQITATPGPSGVVTVSAPGATNSPQQVQVNVSSVTPGNPFGSFDTPANNTTNISGAIPVTGWALDNIEIISVDIWREPIGGEPVGSNGLVFIGNAFLVAGARPDVESGFPNTPLNYRAGWGYMLLTNFLPGSGNGTYILHAIAHNKAGTAFDLGARTITANNANATKPFGTIDTPDQGGMASGRQFVNFGWALTQNPFCIATDGSTITVIVDGATVGHPVYNNARADIATLFPGRCNSGGAIGFFTIDTTLLANGVHTLAWVVFDNQGRGDGIGSRYFTAFNNGAGVAQTAPAEAAQAIGAPRLRTGFDLNRELDTLAQDPDGGYSIDMEEIGRIELATGATGGYLVVDGERRSLPAGSMLKDGMFYWQPGPGFLGEYRLEFDRPDGSTLRARIRIGPKTFPE